MDGEQVFNGWVWTRNNELIGVAVHRYHMEGRVVFDVYYGDGDSDDELFTLARFKERFGTQLYSTVEDFKRGDSISADRILV